MCLGQPFICPQEVRDLGEAAFADQLADGIATVEQPAVGAIDERKGSLPREDARQTR
jgi:hypothetical protein